MDVLNSVGSEAAQARSSRMRTWYLLEQYKALEQSQLDAAERLRSRSYQDGLLTRELAERRQRRVTNPSLSCSEIRLQDTLSDTRSAADEFYEQFCECHDEDLCQALDSDASLDSEGSVDDSKVGKPLEYESENENGMDVKDDERCSNDDVNSVVEKPPSPEEAADLQEQLEAAKKDIAQNIQMQLAAFRSSPPPTEYEVAATTTTAAARCQCRPLQVGKRVPRVNSSSNTSVLALWTRLVSFAYQVTQLNHGNCYCDYSSQVLTAVLAFDVLRRGLCGICNVLQPYVSPIKFPTDDDDSDHNIMSVNKKQLTCKWRRKPNKKLKQRSKSKQLHRYESAKRVSYSEEISEYAFLNENEHSNHVVSEPWRNVSSQTQCERQRWCPTPTSRRRSIRDLGPETSVRAECFQTYCEGVDRATPAPVLNPMLHVVQYVDQMLDLDERKHIF